MRNKMITNEKMIPTKIFKKAYVQSWVSSNILTQLEPWLRKNNTQSFAIASKMLDMLTLTFDNSNRK